MSDKWKIELRKDYEARIAKFEPCPVSVRSRTGNKVSWFYYATLEQAQIASQWAAAQAEWYWQLGFDYGYCSPGSIRETDDQLFEVCFP